jgi:hypothetical protein
VGPERGRDDAHAAEIRVTVQDTCGCRDAAASGLAFSAISSPQPTEKSAGLAVAFQVGDRDNIEAIEYPNVARDDDQVM